MGLTFSARRLLPYLWLLSASARSGNQPWMVQPFGNSAFVGVAMGRIVSFTGISSATGIRQYPTRLEPDPDTTLTLTKTSGAPVPAKGPSNGVGSFTKSGASVHCTFA